MSNSPIHGRGLVAAAPITRDEVLWQPHPDFALLNNDQRKVSTYDFISQVDDGVFSRNSSTAWRYNHSCTPNSVIFKRKMIALRDIRAGEEVTYDYGLTEVDHSFQIWCQCNSETCRKLVTNKDFLNVSLVSSDATTVPAYVAKKSNAATPLDRWLYRFYRTTLLTKHRFLPDWQTPLFARRLLLQIMSIGPTASNLSGSNKRSANKRRHPR